jgi:Putative peptidoglycan binding domain
VRSRRNDERRSFARRDGAAGSLLRRAWAKATRRPVDSAAIVAAAAASLFIIVNAVFLQSGSHPAPFFANTRASQVTPDSRAKPPEPIASARPLAAPLAPQPVAVRRNDPIAELIGPSPRIAAVQRALSEFGYGQIKPSGVLDEPTGAAIEKFERERKLPVSGRISDRLMGDLTAMVGHPLE